MLDINPEMLEEGKKRFARTMYHDGQFSFKYSFGSYIHRLISLPLSPIIQLTGPQISFTLGNAEDLKTIPDNSQDLYTIAFGIRNCTHVDRVLKEAYRVLKPGGVFSCLEFGKVSNPILGK